MKTVNDKLKIVIRKKMGPNNPPTTYKSTPSPLKKTIKYKIGCMGLIFFFDRTNVFIIRMMKLIWHIVTFSRYCHIYTILFLSTYYTSYIVNIFWCILFFEILEFFICCVLKEFKHFLLVLLCVWFLIKESTVFIAFTGTTLW